MLSAPGRSIRFCLKPVNRNQQSLFNFVLKYRSKIAQVINPQATPPNKPTQKNIKMNSIVLIDASPCPLRTDTPMFMLIRAAIITTYSKKVIVP